MIEKGEIYMGFFSAIKDRMSSEEYDMGACILCGKELYGKRIVATQKFVFSKEGLPLKDGTCICKDCRHQYLSQYKIPQIMEQDKQAIYQELVDQGVNLPVLSDVQPSINAVDVSFVPSKQLFRILCPIDNSPSKTDNPALEIDEDRQLMRFYYFEKTGWSSGVWKTSTRKMKDLVDFELVDDGEKIIDGNSLAGALVGGVIAGGVGALVGTGMRSKKVKDKCKNLTLRIVFNDLQHPEEYMHFVGDTVATSMGRNMNRSSKGFKQILQLAQECVSILTVVRERNKDRKEASTTIEIASSSKEDVLGQIKKLGELHDAGILTDEEFSAKKQELLNRL